MPVSQRPRWETGANCSCLHANSDRLGTNIFPLSSPPGSSCQLLIVGPISRSAACPVQKAGLAVLPEEPWAKMTAIPQPYFVPIVLRNWASASSLQYLQLSCKNTEVYGTVMFVFRTTMWN